MKSMQRRLRNGRKRLLVLSMLMLVLCPKVMAQSVMQSTTEKSDSGNAASGLTIEEVMEIAEEEIERTAQEAVKAALLEVGGELAYEKERAEELERQKLALEIENKKLKEECQKKDKNFLYGVLVGGTGGVVLISVVMGLLGGIK